MTAQPFVPTVVNPSDTVPDDGFADYTEPDFSAIRRWVFPLCSVLKRYHRFEVRGLEHVPKEGPGLMVLGHGLATYDLFLLAQVVYEEYGRIIRALAHRLWFELPVMKQVADATGMANASPGHARALINSGELVGVAPGGVKEMVRSYRERFQVRWEQRRGFVKLALETGAPVILGTCPAADLIYTVYPSMVTDWVYNQFKLPLPIIRGFGLTVVPRPTKLIYHVGEPITPPPIAGDEATPAEIEAFHHDLVEQMTLLINRAVKEDGLDGFRTA